MYIGIKVDWRASGNSGAVLRKGPNVGIIKGEGFGKMPEMGYGGVGKTIFAVQSFLPNII